MKKLLALLIVLGFGVIVLVGCGGSGNDTSDAAIIGEWSWEQTGTSWFRFYEDGRAVNLSDNEEFTWNEDGTFSNARVYRYWSVDSDDILTVTWSTEQTFSYERASD